MKKTIIDLFEHSAEKYADNDFLLEKQNGHFKSTTYKQSREAVYNIGAGLVALGVKQNDKISILSEGRNAWILAELGLLYAGAVSVPLSIKLNESNDLLFRLQHAEVCWIIVSANQLSKIRAIKGSMPLLKQIIVIDEIEYLQEKELCLSQVIIRGEKYLKENKESFLNIGHNIDNDRYATITYTSGTTSDPKGVILSHRNYTANVEQALTCMQIPPTYRTLIILPLDHCFAHVVGFYIMIECGAAVATVQVGRTPMETLKNIPVNIKEVKPDFLLSVPALAKTFRRNIETNIMEKGNFTVKLFKMAMKTAYKYNKDGYSKGSGFSFLLKPLIVLFDKIIFEKIREGFGGNLKFFVGGGALLDIELQRFFYAIGMPMYQGYGLSEATPVISTNAINKHKFGSSGILVKPMDLKITDENGNELPAEKHGEIVIRGENVMCGYWKNAAATSATIRNGWLYTGDLGYMSKEGFLYVLGRFKSLLISSDGEKYSPEGMEEAIVDNSLFIEQILIHNNQNPYTVALIYPDYVAIKEYLKNKIDKNTNQQRFVINLIKSEIDKYKSGGIFAGEFPERWLPQSFVLLVEPFTEQNALVNSTMKIMRGKVEKHYAAEINFMYTATGKDVFNLENEKVLSEKL